MSRWRAALLAGLLAGGLQTVATAASGAAGQGDTARPGGATHPGAATHRPAASRAKSGRPSTVRSVLVARSPFGLSIEYPLLERALGAGPCPSRALIDTFRELGSPSLRVGGDSQDLAGPSAAYHYAIPASFWPALGCLARETGIQIAVGLNFGAGTVADNRATIAAAERAIPAAQLSFSLGNEPDLYGIAHILPNEPTFTVPALRPPSWSASAYASEWTSRRALLGPIRLEGPDLAGSGWRQVVGGLLRRSPPEQIDAHIYPTAACGPAPTATAARLLSEHASVGLVEKLAWLVQAARAVHRAAVVSESNSASCAGKPGLSDTPVASVWAARYVLGTLLAGFAQVRFHSAGTSYDPFAFNPDGTLTRRPLADALFFLHRWVGLRSRVSSSSTSHSQVFAVSVVDGPARSTIVSSFANRTLALAIPIEGSRTRVSTDALTTTSAADVRASLPVLAHRVRLELAPNTVVALKTN